MDELYVSCLCRLFSLGEETDRSLGPGDAVVSLVWLFLGIVLSDGSRSVEFGSELLVFSGL